jgi:hypothetical protein
VGNLSRQVIALAAVVAVALYITLGIGYHRTVVACYNSRHSLDREPMVFGGAVGAAFDVAFWPVFQAANGLHGIDCHPRPEARLLGERPSDEQTVHK